MGESSTGGFRQSQNNSCGVAALAYLMTEKGVPGVSEASLAALAAGFYPNNRGLPPGAGYSLADLKRLVEGFGLDARGLRVTPAQLSRHRLPALLRLRGPEGPHYVVLLALDADRARVFDPAQGLLDYARLGLLARWLEASGTGITLEIR